MNMSFGSVLFTDILNTINDELRKAAARDTESVLRQRGFEGLSSFSLENIMDEIKTLCPVSFRVLSEMLELSYNKEKKIAPLCLVYGVIMFKRYHEMSLLQRINTLLLSDSDANTEVNYNYIYYIYKFNLIDAISFREAMNGFSCVKSYSGMLMPGSAHAWRISCTRVVRAICQ
jgi:hypothetical protein